MQIRDLARRLALSDEDVVRVAVQLGLPATDARMRLTNTDAWNIEKELVGPVRQQPLNLPLGRAPITRSKDRRWSSQPGMTKAVLRAWGIDYSSNPAERVDSRDLAKAEFVGDEWARVWMTDTETERWLRSNRGIEPAIAAQLRLVGISPEEAAMRIPDRRGWVSPLSIAVRVSLGELTAAEAAALVGLARSA